MRLADFIDAHVPEILEEWEAFAATRLPAASGMSALELRDHAPQILQAIATDLRASQTAEEQSAKSQGRAPVVANAPQTAAQVHGIARARSGFDINQMVSEYRALRATVLRMWGLAERPSELLVIIEDTIRFNEAIDQAIAESVALFTEEVDRARNLFLGILGHELRSPLNAIQMTSRYLARLRSDPEVGDAVQRLIGSGGRMKALLDDLVEYSRTKLAVGILIRPAEADLAQVCTGAIDEIRAAEPGREVQLRTIGHLRGDWDARRLHQLVTNLLLNAFSYRTPDTPVVLELDGSGHDVIVSVANEGPPIPRETLRTLFEPLQRGLQNDGSREEGNHLGLGLFVSREIVKAHHGRIEAHSSDGKTVFRVQLPRAAR